MSQAFTGNSYISPVIKRFIVPGTRVYTDEYDIYQHLPDWGFNHQPVYYSRGEYRSLLLLGATPSGDFARKIAALPGCLSVSCLNARIRDKDLLRPLLEWLVA